MERSLGIEMKELRPPAPRVAGERGDLEEAPEAAQRHPGAAGGDRPRRAHRGAEDQAGRGGGQPPGGAAAPELRGHPRRRAQGGAGEGRAGGGQPAPGGLDRQEVHQPRAAVPGPDPGGQHRPDEGGGQVRVQARLQVLHLRHLVDPPGHHPRDRRSGPHHPHPGAHDRDDQQADPDQPLPGAGDRPRADAGGDRREDGAPARQGAQGPEDRQGADLASRRRSARRKTPTWATSSRTRAWSRPRMR